MLQKIFAGNLKVLPTIGWPAGKDLWFGGWEYTILPTLTGCFSYIATYARLLKTSMLDVINQDYVLTAESKGKPRTDYPPPYPSELVYPGYHTASDVGCHVYHRLLLH